MAVDDLFSGECNDCFILAFSLSKCGTDCLIVGDGCLNVTADNHCTCFSLYFSGGNDLVVEVFYDDFSFLGDWVFVAFDKCFECFLSFFLVKEGVIFDSFDEFVVTFYRGVILENIEDEVFLNGLFHCVGVEGFVFCCSIRSGIRCSEEFKSFIFGGGGEGEVACIGKHFAVFDNGVYHIFNVRFFFVCGRVCILTEEDIHGC